MIQLKNEYYGDPPIINISKDEYYLNIKNKLPIDDTLSFIRNMFVKNFNIYDSFDMISYETKKSNTKNIFLQNFRVNENYFLKIKIDNSIYYLKFDNNDNFIFFIEDLLNHYFN